MTNLPILLFDDSCGVCHWLVRFVIRHDRGGRFRFASLNSRAGLELVAQHAITGAPDSVVVIDESGALVRSDAVLRIVRHLGGGWRVLGVLRIVPQRWRDAAYDAFARRRAAISRRFGLGCPLPAPAERGRWL